MKTDARGRNAKDETTARCSVSVTTRPRATAVADPPQAVGAPAGLTLMEVILGLAIFVGSIAIVSKLVELGVRASQYARLQTRAVMLAESKMGELVAGVVSLDSSGGDVFTEDPAWQWELSVSDGPVDGLRWVTVTVAPAASGELQANRDSVSFTLSRWLLDPSYSTDLDSAASSAASSSGTSTGSTSSGTGGSGGTTGSTGR